CPRTAASSPDSTAEARGPARSIDPERWPWIARGDSMWRTRRTIAFKSSGWRKTARLRSASLAAFGLGLVAAPREAAPAPRAGSDDAKIAVVDSLPAPGRREVRVALIPLRLLYRLPDSFLADGGDSAWLSGRLLASGRDYVLERAPGE